MRYAITGAFVALFWLLLSGYFKTLLLIFGAGSLLFTLYLSGRMRVIDKEAAPVHLLPRAVTFWPWLIWEMIKSAWTVAKIIVNPSLPISPTMTVVRPSQKTDVGVSIYANSITLTPGTITTGATSNLLTVHALTREGALDLEGGGMDARVTQFEGER